MADDDLLLSNINTLGDMASRITRWARERIDRDTACDAINDAIETLWMAASLATLSKFSSGPVSRTIPAQSTSFQFVSIPDPTAYPQCILNGGSNLPQRTYEVAFAYVTDSGSSTRVSPAVTFNLDASTLLAVQPPDNVDQAMGWYLYAGPSGQMVQQNAIPMPFDQMWIEPPQGIKSAPDGPLPPRVNTTGDNIYAIQRIDVANQDLTVTNWLQTTLNSSVFTQYLNRYPVPSTFPRHAYDLVNNTTVQFAPAAGMDLPATLFYTVRPRRLRFLRSKLPFTSFVSQPFIFRQALADILLSLYEDKSADSWQARADNAKRDVILSIAGENWNRNDSVRQYMRY